MMDTYKVNLLSLCLLVYSTDKLCKQFEFVPDLDTGGIDKKNHDDLSSLSDTTHINPDKHCLSHCTVIFIRITEFCPSLYE